MDFSTPADFALLLVLDERSADDAFSEVYFQLAVKDS